MSHKQVRGNRNGYLELSQVDIHCDPSVRQVRKIRGLKSSQELADHEHQSIDDRNCNRAVRMQDVANPDSEADPRSSDWVHVRRQLKLWTVRKQDTAKSHGAVLGVHKSRPCPYSNPRKYHPVVRLHEQSYWIAMA